MNNVNHIRFLLACFAMVFTLGALAEDGPKQNGVSRRAKAANHYETGLATIRCSAETATR